jgi:hypothetical protein
MGQEKGLAGKQQVGKQQVGGETRIAISTAARLRKKDLQVNSYQTR